MSTTTAKLTRGFFLIALIIVAGVFFSGCIPQLDKRKYAGLQVTLADVPASIYLDGEFISDTPFKQNDLKPGVYTLKIQPDDSSLVPYELPITLSGGLLTAVVWTPSTRPELSGGVIFELERLSTKQQTELVISSIPDGVIVRVDGGDIEFAPSIRTDLSPGKHTISFSQTSYDDQEHTINLVAGHRLSVSVKMARNQNSLGMESSDATQIRTTQTASSSATITTTATTSGSIATGGLAPTTKSPTASPALSTSPNSTANPEAVRTAQPLAVTGSGSSSGSGKIVTILPTGFFQNGEEVVRVRTASSSAALELGFAKVGQAYVYLNVTTNDWIQIQFNSKPGWISKTYGRVD